MLQEHNNMTFLLTLQSIQASFEPVMTLTIIL